MTHRILANYLDLYDLMFASGLELLMLLANFQSLLKVKNTQTNQICFQKHRSLVSFMAVLSQTNHLHQKLLKELVVPTNYLVCQNLKSAKLAYYQIKSFRVSNHYLVVGCRINSGQLKLDSDQINSTDLVVSLNFMACC